MRFSDKFANVKPSATLAINSRALELKAQGVDVISVAAGEPDFPTPPYICEAAKAALDAGFTKYTAVAGIPELRKAVGGYFKRQYGVEPEPQNVIVTNGGKQALYNIMQALLNVGDEVLIPSPYWVSYPDMVALAGGVPVPVPTSVEDDFKLRVEMLEKFATPKMRMLILNSPSNPTGAVYSQAKLDALIQWAVARDIFVVSDEIYDQLTYAPAVPASAISLWERYPDHIAVCNGVAKAYAMTGWRVGYCVASAELIKICTTLQGQCTSNVCSVAQKAAVAALDGPLDCVVEMRKAFVRRRDMAYDIIRSWDKALCPKPDGAFYLFVDVHQYFRPDMPDSTALCKYLLEEAHVAAVPGGAFGDPHCIRISYSVADAALKEALLRIGKVLHG